MTGREDRARARSRARAMMDGSTAQYTRAQVPTVPPPPWVHHPPGYTVRITVVMSSGVKCVVGSIKGLLPSLTLRE